MILKNLKRYLMSLLQIDYQTICKMCQTRYIQEICLVGIDSYPSSERMEILDEGIFILKHFWWNCNNFVGDVLKLGKYEVLLKRYRTGFDFKEKYVLYHHK